MAVCCANIAAASRASCSLVVPGTYKRANALIKFKVFSLGEEVLGVKCGIGIVLFVLQHNNAYVAHLFCLRANYFAPCRELSFFSLILDAKAAQVVHRTVVDIQVYLMVDARKFAAISVLPELPFALIA